MNHKLIAIAAVDLNNGLGRNNHLCWDIRVDMNHFKKITWNYVVIMGANTFRSMHNVPLVFRDNIVITNNPSKLRRETEEAYHKNKICDEAFTSRFARLDFMPLNELDDFLTKKDFELRGQKLFLIGGAQLYDALIDECQQVYLTTIFKTYLTDCRFPNLNEHGFTMIKNIRNGDFYDRMHMEKVPMSIDLWEKIK